MIICFKCFDTSINSHNDEDVDFCATDGCQGSPIVVDDNICPSLMELNDRGYKTVSSCSGHYKYGESTSVYILFDKVVNKNCFAHLPKNFIRDADNPRKIIRTIEYSDILNVHRQLFEAALDLLQWSQDLPWPFEILARFGYKYSADNFVQTIQNEFDLALYDDFGDFSHKYIFSTTMMPENAEACKSEIKESLKAAGLEAEVDIFEYEPRN